MWDEVRHGYEWDKQSDALNMQGRREGVDSRKYYILFGRKCLAPRERERRLGGGMNGVPGEIYNASCWKRKKAQQGDGRGRGETSALDIMACSNRTVGRRYDTEGYKGRKLVTSVHARMKGEVLMI